MNGWCILIWVSFGPAVLLATQDSAELKRQDGSSLTAEATDEISIDCRAIIERHSIESTRFVAKVDLPTLEGGKRYRINLCLVNPHDERIQFSAVALSCGCGKLTGDTREIPELGSASFALHLKIPNSYIGRKASHTATFSGLDPSFSVLRVGFSYEVSNVFSFSQRQVSVDVSESDAVVVARLPFMLVSPMTLEHLQATVSENLEDAAVKIVQPSQDFDVEHVLVEIPRKSVPRHGIRGEVKLRHTETGETSAIQLIISHQELLTIRPESIRFRRVDSSQPFEASAMLRIASKTNKNQPGTPQNQETEEIRNADETRKLPPDISVTIGGEKAVVDVKPFGKSEVYKLTIRYNHDSDEATDARWTIIIDGVERVIDSRAFFSTN